ncbi:MAG TPA: DUF3617 family protein [Dissulfurispiraceae bacterium]|nr:DUF3617 family protein [Dissulfurispiraceae bacterium]
MKRSALFIAAVVFTVVGLMIAGCGEKPKDGAQAPAPTATAPKVNMQDGQWEITVMNEMPGLPAGMMKPHTFATCLSQKEPIAKPQDQPADCKMQDVKVAGNTVTWGVVCPDMSSKGTITYAGTSYDGLTETTMKVEGKEMKMKTTMKGKYIGPCPSPSPAPAQK